MEAGKRISTRLSQVGLLLCCMLSAAETRHLMQDDALPSALPDLRAAAEERMESTAARIEALNVMAAGLDMQQIGREKLQAAQDKVGADLAPKIICKGSVCTMEGELKETGDVDLHDSRVKRLSEKKTSKNKRNLPKIIPRKTRSRAEPSPAAEPVKAPAEVVAPEPAPEVEPVPEVDPPVEFVADVEEGVPLVEAEAEADASAKESEPEDMKEADADVDYYEDEAEAPEKAHMHGLAHLPDEEKVELTPFESWFAFCVWLLACFSGVCFIVYKYHQEAMNVAKD